MRKSVSGPGSIPPAHFRVLGIVRATHLMRTTPLPLWTKQAEAFDSCVRETVFQCLGLQFSPQAYDQVSVSTTIGGLGVRRIVDHAQGAFSASWHEAKVVTKESFSPVSGCDCTSTYVSQQKASSKVDADIMSKLIAAANKRDAQRLNRLDSPHANAWLSARPSWIDGNDTILPPKIFRTAVAPRTPCAL